MNLKKMIKNALGVILIILIVGCNDRTGNYTTIKKPGYTYYYTVESKKFLSEQKAIEYATKICKEENRDVTIHECRGVYAD